MREGSGCRRRRVASNLPLRRSHVGHLDIGRIVLLFPGLRATLTERREVQIRVVGKLRVAGAVAGCFERRVRQRLRKEVLSKLRRAPLECLFEGRTLFIKREHKLTI